MTLRHFRTTVIAIAVCDALSTSPTEGQAPDLDQRISLFARYVDPLRTQLAIPALSAAVASRGRIIWESGFGYAR